MPGRVLIVDDHVEFRTIVAKMLLESWTIVGEAGTAGEAVLAATRLRPDLVLLDVHLPDGMGFDIVADLTRTGAAVVLTSTRSASDFGDSVARSGALGFVSKEQLSSELLSGLLEQRSM